MFISTISSGLNKKETASVIIAGALLIYLVLLICSARCWAAGSVVPDTRQPKRLELVVGKSIVLETAEAVKRVSIGDPKIADFTLLSRREIYITGKAVGATNLSLWQNKKVFAIYDLDVAYDISRLKQKLHDVFPDEKDLRVVATHDSITLSGTVSSTANLSQVLSLAEAYAPDGKVRNLLQVAGVQQVMLEVRAAEMSRSLTKRLGINFNYARGGNFGVSLLSGLTKLVQPEDAYMTVPTDRSYGAGPLGLLVSPSVSALFRFNSGSTTWTGFIDALKDDGLVKILAEPTLIALSGKTANFLAGGEFPVPVPQGLGTVAIEYKSFGVRLGFTPTVLSENKINVVVNPEVSEPDFSTAIQFQGFVVPGLTTRRASTSVELADGQSFAIAGLLKENVRESISKFPLLGDIPILGALFRSQAFLKQETELIIIVTPHLVKPLDLAKQTMPTDYYIEPTDAEFYLLGLTEGREKQESANTSGELDGEFGHAMPVTK
jgi:pilus assembly protein CpaC